MDINLGSRVICRDGTDIGKVDRLVLDPDHYTLLAFIVHRGHPLTKDRIVRREHVARIGDDGLVHLSLSAAQAEAFPVFFEHEFVVTGSHDLERLGYPVSGVAAGRGAAMQPIYGNAPASGGAANPGMRGIFEPAAMNLPPESVTLDHGTGVVDADGKKLGVVVDVTYAANGAISEIVARTGRVHHERLCIPIAQVAGIAHDHIRLNVTRAHISPTAAKG
jgi:uncharacterized protein YrrD